MYDTYFHALGVNAGIAKGDMALGYNLAADCTSCCVVAFGTTAAILLYIEFFTQSLLAEFAPTNGPVKKAQIADVQLHT